MRQWYYYPDYHKMYPDVEISKEVMDVLRKSDRKMRYFESDLKKKKETVDSQWSKVDVKPARECYFDQAQKELDLIAASKIDLESQIVQSEQVLLLNLALKQLTEEEYRLIRAIYYQGMTVREYAGKFGMPVMTVQNRKKRILMKLKKFIKAKNILVQTRTSEP